jgi:signal transduction histidine kinase
MRRRLLVTVMVLVAMVVVGLGVPLALSDARRATERQFEDRLADTVRFAALAQRPVVDDAPADLVPELERYDQVYRVEVVMLGRDGRPWASSRPAQLAPSVSDDDRVSLALAGRGSEPYPIVLPWRTEPMVLAEPVLVDGEVRGAMVTVSPTDSLRRAVSVEWALLLVGGLLALALAALAALPLVRWIMRPVQALDTGLSGVASSVLSGEPAEPLAAGKGPPELRRLILSFDRMAAAVSQAITTQRKFVEDASHQLRNPLTALRLRLDNVVGHVDAGANEEHLAALEEAGRLGDVLDGLLALARADRLATELITVELDPEIDEGLDRWRVLAEAYELTLARTGQPGLAARVPPGAVRAVLDNVLDNAIKFSPAGGRVTEHVAAEPGQGDAPVVLLSVRDQGPGIAPDELPRATDRFWRSPTQRAVEGSGLGLAIVRATVMRCHGELNLAPAEGGGLLVTVRLPACASG